MSVRAAAAALLLVAACAAISAWWSWPASPPPNTKRDAARADGAAAQPQAMDRGAAVERTEVGADAATASLAPIPAGLTAVEVRVVDWATHEPVAGADVWWLDAEGQARIDALPEAECQRRWSDPEAKVRTYGNHARSDDRGVVRVWAPSERNDVLARHDKSVGWQDVRDSDATCGVELEISREHVLTVRVVDGAACPIAGVPLELGAGWGASTSDAEGVACMKYREAWAGRNARPDTTVRVPIPGLESCVIAFPWASPPPEPLTLVLPPTGELHVHVLHPGRAIESLDASIWIGAPDDLDAKVHEWRLDADAERVVRFRVPIGGTFEVQVRVGDLELQRTVRGPVLANEIVRTNVDVPPAAVALVGRVLDEHGRPVASEKNVWLESNLHRSTNSLWIRTDARGCFVWHPAAIDGVPPRDLTEFVLSVRYGLLDDIVHGAAAPRALQPGVNDLGDIHLARLPLLVAGRFECATEPSWIRIAVQRWRDAAPPAVDGQWEDQRDFRNYQLDGRFVVRGSTAPGRLRITFDDRAEPVEFAPGTVGLVVPLRTEKR